MSTYADTPVGQLVRQSPARSRIMEQYGIDYCCSGRVSLAEACKKQGLDVQQMCDALQRGDAAAESSGGSDWSDATLAGLIGHIVETHHVYLRHELPRLQSLLNRVSDKHAANHPELRELSSVFAAMTRELLLHMQKEEQVLFPWVKKLEQDPGPAHACCDSVQSPIAVMEDEHERAGHALARIRWLTGDYSVPRGACSAYQALLSGLAELETDLHQHIHKENNILFPRAAELEELQLTTM